ncbi:hypothetical protein [Acuticoccus yangtzensis]|uniref:hypothetical protein n=1 Tax=Acuticoccus yangtzensis TaxID=1443441 RepID=UPI0013004C11|nr:hypothetical protein [Acuticoccus yangtzensis]
MTHTQPNQAGQRPQFRAYIVREDEDGQAEWTEISGLWPTKSLAGFSGTLQTPIAVTNGRLVIMPATQRSHDA